MRAKVLAPASSGIGSLVACARSFDDLGGGSRLRLRACSMWCPVALLTLLQGTDRGEWRGMG